jgi:2-polyprenyl-3-methyl-5-hydroxy-6-metoxy-1,4-benzoquinol methylase
MITPTINLGNLAFYWRMTDKFNTPPNVVPDFVPFEFSFLEDLQLIIQTRNAETWKHLETIYKENYNVGYLQEGHDLAEGYGNDFIAFLTNSIQKFNPDAKVISEVGAGACYILKKFKEKGFEVNAIDPSPIAVEKGKEYGITVVPEFYPSDKNIPKSDLIIHYDVLEHVTDPVDFLSKHKKDLREGGLVAFAVPDCTSYIESGDISMILHEHLNYYDAQSLRNVMEAAGFEVLEIRKANYGGVLYCVGKVNANPKWTPLKGTQKFETFAKKVAKLKKDVFEFIREGTSPGNTLGCYIPLRIIPYLSILNLTSGIRFFDDNSGIYHQYFDGFPVPVENKNDLIERPVTHLLIMSSAFGEKIRSKVLESVGGKSIKIKILSDFN